MGPCLSIPRSLLSSVSAFSQNVSPPMWMTISVLSFTAIAQLCKRTSDGADPAAFREQASTDHCQNGLSAYKKTMDDKKQPIPSRLILAALLNHRIQQQGVFNTVTSLREMTLPVSLFLSWWMSHQVQSIENVPKDTSFTLAMLHSVVTIDFLLLAVITPLIPYFHGFTVNEKGELVPPEGVDLHEQLQQANECFSRYTEKGGERKYQSVVENALMNFPIPLLRQLLETLGCIPSKGSFVSLVSAFKEKGMQVFWYLFADGAAGLLNCGERPQLVPPLHENDKCVLFPKRLLTTLPRIIIHTDKPVVMALTPGMQELSHSVLTGTSFDRLLKFVWDTWQIPMPPFALSFLGIAPGFSLVPFSLRKQEGLITSYMEVSAKNIAQFQAQHPEAFSALINELGGPNYKKVLQMPEVADFLKHEMKQLQFEIDKRILQQLRNRQQTRAAEAETSPISYRLHQAFNWSGCAVFVYLQMYLSYHYSKLALKLMVSTLAINLARHGFHSSFGSK